jgi:hypothetical protein
MLYHARHRTAAYNALGLVARRLELRPVSLLAPESVADRAEDVRFTS